MDQLERVEGAGQSGVVFMRAVTGGGPGDALTDQLGGSGEGRG